ncbi:MAG TPA: DUF6335 family protein [Vicinamibacterales bacterium]|jgi:hypothetical protein|nr:DUF6335 family protein [Vicinamibacterales bacterium]
MAKRKAPARRRSAAAPKRAAAHSSSKRGRAAARKAARKAAARKPARKAKKAARPAPKRAAKKAVKRAAPKAAARRIIRRVVKKAAPAQATARKPIKAIAKKAAAKPKASPAPARAVAPKPKVAAAAGAGKKKHALGLDRARRIVGDDDDIVSPTPPSSLNLDRSASSARSGRQELKERYDKHTETSPALTGGDVDADWESAYSTGDEAPGGDNPTPDQNNVDDIGLALGVEYEDSEELEGADKIVERDKHRWEDDPASSEDFEDR